MSIYAIQGIPRRKPVASAIAAALLEDPAILALRTKRLVLDIRERFGCSVPTAMDAIDLARTENRGD